MLPTLRQRRQLLTLAIQRQTFDGKKFKDGAISAALAASLWARNQAELTQLVCSSLERSEIPDGIIMPWGTIVKP